MMRVDKIIVDWQGITRKTIIDHKKHKDRWQEKYTGKMKLTFRSLQYKVNGRGAKDKKSIRRWRLIIEKINFDIQERDI